jgi:hypothetical protein
MLLFAEWEQNEKHYIRVMLVSKNNWSILCNFLYILEKQFVFYIFEVKNFIELGIKHRKYHILMLEYFLLA